MENKIADLPYLPGKIKNNTLFEKEGIRVVVISISVGDQLAPHSAPVDALVVGLEGEAEVVLQGKTHRITPHQSIQFPAKAIHSVKAITNFKMLLIK